ncbi:protein phosphatase CheZ [Tepidiphilus olei]|uniref:protein phosphatase CheZ n=1 Tax=Tepidiphilus olei TaxID=2502184 RepID=UPI00115C5684|nr:protein phosphatase CheZ [Tepidiphilus olei]
MSKKTDQSGDSDELQALFDSIVGSAGNVSEPEQPVEGDNEELQALFDAVAQQFSATEKSGMQANASAAAPEPMHVPHDEIIQRLGKVARQLHEALKELGCETVVAEAAQAVPDARERLRYIAQLTEQAASRVLNATDIAIPLQKTLAEKAEGLKKRWDDLFANRLSPQEFRQLAHDTRAFLADVADTSHATTKQLMEIMMAQDFQDLTGQVIKKVIEIVGRIETELLQILIEAIPEESRPKKVAEVSLMNGPVIDSRKEGVITSQEEVDDLLKSLGF